MKQYAEIFKALADESRLKILCMIACGELCACDIQDDLNLTQPTISHHMKVLQKVNLIEVRKKGKWVFYSINERHIEKLCGFIENMASEDQTIKQSKINCSCKRDASLCGFG